MRKLILSVLSVSLLTIDLLSADPVTVIGLGGFGGASSIGYAISNTGVVVGWSATPAGDSNAFLSTGTATLTNLNGSSSESYAYGVNNAGTAVGTSYVNGAAHGTIWGPSGLTDLGAGSFGLGINNSGEVVGGDGQAFIDTNGTLQNLGNLPTGNWSSAYAVNDSGLVAGYGSVVGNAYRGFVWSPSTGYTVIPTFGGNNSYAFGINNSGQVVGNASTVSGYANAFLYSNGVMTNLGTLGGNSSYAYGINNLGAVVGYSWLAGNTTEAAFLYYNGVLTDLNTLIPANSGWDLQQAYGINDAGDIVGTGTYNGQTEAFLIDPVNLSAQALSTPEPATFGTLAAGLGMLLMMVGRNRRNRVQERPNDRP